MDIDYAYGRENDPKIYRFSIIHNNRIVSNYPKRYHEIDMLLLHLKGIDSDNYRELIFTNKKLITLATETSEFPYFENNTKTISSTHGNLAWYYILDGDYKLSIENASKGLSLYPDNQWIKTNMAHAYLLNGNLEKAKQIYTENKNLIIHNEKFSVVCLKDLKKFQDQNISIPNYLEIKTLLEN